MNEPLVVVGESIANLPDIPPSKECIRCKRTVVLTDFPVNDLTEDGRDQICTNCNKFRDTKVNLQALSRKKRQTKKGKRILEGLKVATTIAPDDDFVPIEEEPVEELSMSEPENDPPETAEKPKQKSGFRENLGDETEQSVYTKDVAHYELGGREGDIAGKKELKDAQDEGFCVEWVASDGDGAKAWAKGYGKQEKGRKVEKMIDANVKRFDIACRIRYLRDEKAVEECGFDVAQGKGKWMEAVCKLAMDATTARDKLKALELISKAKGHDKMKSNGGGGTVIRVVTGVRGEPGRNQMKDKKEKEE